ncbi:LLM class flavin-dependent oxidoreductase [Salinactinospora qingdaonensis]|uniref:LLM class flavin-dependent oxidoreductase n=1 Tax=Salinactinospora qingdaonensis TaxID=702744 RepID=UPI0031F0CE31
MATQRLGLGTYVVNNEFWNPALLAREAATVDRLSGGRLQLGLGGGHMKWNSNPPAYRGASTPSVWTTWSAPSTRSSAVTPTPPTSRCPKPPPAPACSSAATAIGLSTSLPAVPTPSPSRG